MNAVRKFGKKPAKHDPRTLKFARYLASTLPPPPVSINWGAKADKNWGMYLNDQYGDCTCAGIAHAVQAWSAANGKEISVSDSDVLKAYEEACGFKPGDPSTDNGGVEIDVLNYFRKVGIGGYKLDAFVALEPYNQTHIKQAINLFGVCYIGVSLPVSTEKQDGFWKLSPSGLDGDPTPGSRGGHCVICVGYDAEGIYFVTWGELWKMTWGFWDCYCVVPETKVLTSDLNWVQAGNVKTGDTLFGFDEDGPHRQWKKATVLSNDEIVLPCYRLTFDDGTQVTCSADHMWLTHNHGGSYWIRTDQMRVGGKMSSKVVKPLDVWKEDLSWNAGYLAAAFDGEGHIQQRDLANDAHGGLFNTKLGFAQKDNAMFAQTLACLKEANFPYNVGSAPAGGVLATTICQRREMLRFLGQIRPRRLLSKFDANRMGRMSVKSDERVSLISREFVGEKQVAAIKTDAKTFIAEGLASHNCDESYALLSGVWAPQNRIAPSGFDFSTLQLDLQQVAG